MTQAFRNLWFVMLKKKDVYMLFFLSALLISFATKIVLSGIPISPNMDPKDFLKEIYLSISLLQSFTYASIFCVIFLFPFMIQKMESEDDANKLYWSLPIAYWEIFTVRFISALLFVIAYYLFCNLICLIVCVILYPTYSSLLIDELVPILGNYFILTCLSSLGYLVLVVLFSFLINNMILGSLILLITYGLSFLPILWFMPFSFTGTRLRQ